MVGIIALLVCGAVGYAQAPKKSATPAPAVAVTAALSSADAAAIRAASKVYEEAGNARDWPRTLTLFTDDVVWMPPHAPTITGLKGVEASLNNYPAFKNLRLEPLDIEGRGDLAYVRGRYSLVMTPANQAEQPDSGKYLEVWRKQSNGAWKYARGIFNSDLPVAAPSSASAPSSRIVRLTYMNVEPAKVGDYLKRIREYYIPIHNQRVTQGKLTSWKAYQVAYPNGEAPEYNIVLMSELPGFAHLEPDAAFADTAKKVVGAENYDRVIANPLAKMLRTDTLVLRGATQGWSTATNRFLNVAFLKVLPGKGPELMDIQRGHYLPSTEDSVKEGRMTSWGIATVRFPEQRDPAYTHLSIAGYDSMAQMEKPASPEHREKWGAKGADAMAKLPAVRTRVKGELWQLIDQTKPAGAVKASPE